MIGPASRPSRDSSDRERQLDSAIAVYLQAVEAGRAPDRREFLAQHPDFADELISFFADEDRVRKLAGTMLVRVGAGGARRTSDAISRPDSDAELGVGGEFGDFELMEQIAVGGMGIVFKARQKRLNRVVALKTIRPSALRPGDDAVQRFRVEAEAVARLDHPNIVPIFEMGEYHGYPFLSLKLIEGGDLDRHISRLRGDPTAIAGLMVQVAGAVHYAHLRGILHRDLKPSNILVDRRGRPHVTDFGLAKCVEIDSGLTQTGLIIGTPSFMAPEQVSGPRGEVTTAADVYGLGAVLYTLLSGRPPFQAGSVYETLQQVREQEPVSPGAIDPGVDRDLEAVCLKCLEKDPGRRYASAEAVADDLERWLGGEPIEARPAGRVERAWRWYRRNRLVARLWAGVAALFLAVPVIAVVAFVRQRGLADEAFSSAQKERGARLLADARAEDIRDRLVKMNVANGVRLMEKGDTTGALPWFAEALSFDRDDPGSASAERLRIGTLLNQCPVLDGVFAHSRPILWATLDRDGRRLATASADNTARTWDLASGEAITPILAHDGPVHRVEFRGDGGRLVTASADGTVRIWDLDGGRAGPARRLVHGSPVRIALFSPDGSQVVSGGFDGTIRVWDAEDGTPIGLPHRLGSPLLDLAFSPDGTRVATGATEGSARIWRLEDGRFHRLALLPHRGPVRRVTFSPDGVRIATASEDGTARVWDGRTGDPLTAPLAHMPNRWVVDAEFSPDGTRLATASHDGTARVWDAHTGRLIEFKEAAIRHSIGVGEASFSPDGARVVTAGFDGTARIWDAVSGEPLAPPFYHGGSVLRARFTPDGYQVLTVGSDSTARLWNVTDIGGSAVVVEEAGGVYHATFDSKGRRFATAGGDGIARVWDAANGAAVTPPLLHRRAVTRVAFSPDDRRLATASIDGTARVWDAATGRPVTYALPHDGPVRDVRFSPDGSHLATASSDGRARIWEIATGRIAVPPLEHGQEVVGLAFRADGRWLATASADGTSRVWDVATGRPALPPLESGASVSCVAFRPDGRVLLTACSDSSFAGLPAQQWDLSTGRPLGLPLRHDDGVVWAAYSPDGRRIATASEDRTARVWDAATGEPLTRPLTHPHQVLTAAFSADGRRLATGCLDGTARVWDTSSGEPLSPPFLHRDRTGVGAVAFQPEGRGLLTAGMDGTARVWDLPRDDRPSDVLVLHAQVLAGRRIDQTGGEVPLGTAALLRDWARLREFDSDRTAMARVRARSRIAWHRREARRLELSCQGTAAAWHLKRLDELDPKDTSLAARLVAVYEMSGEWEQLEDAASRAIAAGTDGVEVRVRRGWARINLGRPAAAAEDFRAALEREPDSATIKLGLFLVLAEAGSQSEADALWAAVRNDQDQTRADRWAVIAVHLDRLTEARPEGWWFWRARGLLQMKAGHPEKSEADYDQAIAVKPNDGWSWLGRGLARKQLGRADAALADFAHSATLETAASTSSRMQGEILGDRGQWDQAARAFARWSEVGGDPVAIAWYFHAALRVHARDPDGYRRACRAMVEQFGQTGDPNVATLVARACVLGPEPGVPARQVVELARLGVRGDSTSGWTISTLGAALRRADRLGDAAIQLDKAIRLDPGWPGTPLTSALREVVRLHRALEHSSGSRTPNSRPAGPESKIELATIQEQLAREKAPWYLRLEAALLARELEESRFRKQQ